MIQDHDIKEAMEILSEISGDEEVVKLAEMREKAILDEKTRLNGAKKEGIKLTKKVYKLCSEGKSITDIAKICNISEELVKEILE